MKPKTASEGRYDDLGDQRQFARRFALDENGDRIADPTNLLTGFKQESDAEYSKRLRGERVAKLREGCPLCRGAGELHSRRCPACTPIPEDKPVAEKTALPIYVYIGRGTGISDIAGVAALEGGKIVVRFLCTPKGLQVKALIEVRSPRLTLRGVYRAETGEIEADAISLDWEER